MHLSRSGLVKCFNTLRPRQNGRHFADDIFKYLFLNENVWIPIKISLKFVPKGRINHIPAMVQIMAWRRPGDKPLSEPMMVSLPTHICVTRPQWVNKRNKQTAPMTGNMSTKRKGCHCDCLIVKRSVEGCSCQCLHWPYGCHSDNFLVSASVYNRNLIGFVLRWNRLHALSYVWYFKNHSLFFPRCLVTFRLMQNMHNFNVGQCLYQHTYDIFVRVTFGLNDPGS